MRLIILVAFLALVKSENIENDDDETVGQLELLKTNLKEDQIALASSHSSPILSPRIARKPGQWKPPIDFQQFNPTNSIQFSQNNANFPQGLQSGLQSSLPSGLPSGFPSNLPSGLPSGFPSGSSSGFPSFPGSGTSPSLPSFPSSSSNVFGSGSNFNPQNFWKPNDEPSKDYVQTTTVAPQNNYYGSQNNYNPPQNNYLQPQSDYVPGQNYAPVPPQNNYYLPPNNNYFTTTQRPSTTTPQVEIIKNEHVIGENGNYKYEYQIADGTHVGEVGYVTNPNTDSESIVKKGWYSYVGADGVRYTVKYWADANGFHAEGDHLPKPPPIPPAIQASIEQNKREEEEKNKHQQGYPSPPPQHHYTTTPSPPNYYPTTPQHTYPQQPPQQTYYPQQQQPIYYPQQQPTYYPQQTYYPPQQNYPSYSKTS